MSKPKFFVSYPPGGGGHFLCLLLLSLQHSVSLKGQRSGHQQISLIDTGHNFNTQWCDEFRQHTSFDANTELAVNWLTDTFKFTVTDKKFFVVHTHAHNIEPLSCAWPDAKFLYVTCEQSDLDQLAFNWVTKSALHYGQWDLIQKHLHSVQTQFDKMHSVTVADLMHRRNTRLLTYIVRFANNDRLLKRHNTVAHDRSFNIAFADIASGRLVDQLDQIINTVDIDVPRENYYNAVSLIEQYAAAQLSVPWTLTIDDYT